MTSKNNLKDMLLQELTDFVEKSEKEIKELKEEINTQMFLKSTVNGGAFATAAINACNRRADAARRKIQVIEAKTKWHKEMLEKYS